MERPGNLPVIQEESELVVNDSQVYGMEEDFDVEDGMETYKFMANKIINEMDILQLDCM